jgi:hypothetical protein
MVEIHEPQPDRTRHPWQAPGGADAACGLASLYQTGTKSGMPIALAHVLLLREARSAASLSKMFSSIHKDA